MESYWLQSLESSLRKETHPDVIRTVHIVPHNETWDEFMSRHLVELENNGIGKFTSMKKRGAEHIQWRCERANKCKGKSSGDPTTTRANGCGAYVSFTFVSKNTFNSCIVRLMNKHSGHDLNNPEEGRSNRINSNLIAFIHSCFQLGDSNAEILLKCEEWAKAQGKMDLRDRQYFVSPKDIRMLKKSFHAQTRTEGNDCFSVDHLVKTEAVEVCLQSFLPESLSNTNPTNFLQQPTDSNTTSANDVPFSLSPQATLQINQPEIASSKVSRRMKRKRTAQPDPQEDSLDAPEQTASPSSSTKQQQPPEISNPYSLPTHTLPSTSQFSSYTHSSKPVPLTTFLQSPHSLTSFPSTSNTHTTLVQIHPQPLITTHFTTTITTTTTNTTTTTSTATATITSHTAVLTHSTPSIQHSPAPVSPSSSSTQHTPTPTPASSTPKIFKEICSILPLSSGGKKRRCKITVEELKRRVGPPEYMSFSSLAAYLKTDNNARKELQVQLEEAGIKPTQLTAETSLFSRLCEEEVDALCESLAGLVRDHLPFQGLHIIPEAEDELATVGRLLEFRSHLRGAIAAIKDRVEAVDLASHGFMSKMLDIILSMFEKCLANQMSSRAGQDIDIISIS